MSSDNSELNSGVSSGPQFDNVKPNLRLPSKYSHDQDSSIIEPEEQSYIKMRIEVIDCGVGIKKENLEKLFMNFAKLDEHSKINAQGTGLGLSICKQMIEKMGGSVTVDSIEGVGTTFTVDLLMKAKID